MEKRFAFPVLWVLGPSVFSAACGQADAGAAKDAGSRDGSRETVASPTPTERVASCDGAPAGTPCGSAEQEMHCLYDACVRNACGDAVRSESEECDDGNERGGDGCSARCTREECGNGRLDVGEACDDGNDDDDDGCNDSCKRVEPKTSADAGADGSSPDAGPSGCQTDLSTLTLSAESGADGGVVLKATEVPGATYEWTLAGAPLEGDGFTRTLPCDDDEVLPVVLFVSAPPCPPKAYPLDARCGGPAMDAGSRLPDAGAVVDAAADARTAGPDAASDTDAGPDAAGDTGAGPDAADAGGGSVEVCTGGIDDDEDGLADCEDDDCASDTACVTAGGCDACVRTACSNYQGIDLSGPCFDDGDPVVPGSVPVPEFSKRCTETYACTMRAGPCAQDPLGPAECACGAIDLVTCREQGPAAGAPCVDEWLSATDCADGDWSCMLDLFSDVSLPSGYANYVIECVNAQCSTECFGR